MCSRSPGRKHDPLYRIRKLLLVAAQEQLTSRARARPWAGLAVGDPTGEVAAAWQGEQLLRAVYAAVACRPLTPPWSAATAGSRRWGG